MGSVEAVHGCRIWLLHDVRRSSDTDGPKQQQTCTMCRGWVSAAPSKSIKARMKRELLSWVVEDFDAVRDENSKAVARSSDSVMVRRQKHLGRAC